VPVTDTEKSAASGLTIVTLGSYFSLSEIGFCAVCLTPLVLAKTGEI